MRHHAIDSLPEAWAKIQTKVVTNIQVTVLDIENGRAADRDPRNDRTSGTAKEICKTEVERVAAAIGGGGEGVGKGGGLTCMRL